MAYKYNDRYTNISDGCLKIDDYNNRISLSGYEGLRRETKNKYACYSDTENDQPIVSKLYYSSKISHVTLGAKLYVSSKARISRDTLRNSGYQIVRSPESADYIVIPDVLWDFYTEIKYNILGYQGTADTLYALRWKKHPYSKTKSITDQDIESVEAYLQARGIDILDITNEEKSVTFLPKVEEFFSLLNNEFPQKRYVQESMVPVDCPTDINVETLSIWKRMKDMNMLAKAICTSNWQQYPFTVLAFLHIEKENSNMRVYGGMDFKRILDNLHYDYYESLDAIMKGTTIAPEDWNMWQSFIFHELGLPETGGLLCEEEFNKIPSFDRDLLRTKVAVAPLKLNAPIEYSTLKDIV